MYIRILFFLLLLFSLDLYVYQAFRQFFDGSTTSKTAVAVIYWGLSALSLGYIVLSALDISDHWNKNVLVLIRAVVFIFYISKVPIAVLLGLDDLRRIFSWLYASFSNTAYDSSRSKFLVNGALLLGSIPFVSLLYGLIRNPYRYKLYTDTVKIPQLPSGLQGLRIVQISDIHSGSFTFKEPIRRAIDMINAQQPDLVFFTGDLVNSIADEMDPYMDVFDKIQSKYGIYSILGNHDYGDYYRWETPADKIANMDKLKSIHRALGWQLLLNENTSIDIGGASLGIIGVENISGKMHFKKYGDMAAATLDCPDCDMKILLSHDPSHWETEVVADYQDIDLTLSGHTHGMQFGIEIPGFIKWSPVQYVYEKWAGLYKQGNQYLYVNRGLGFLGYPGRVGILPEITLLQLESA